MTNYLDTFRGVVHIGDPATCGGEFTVCGLSWDEPSTEHNADAMEPSERPPTCPDCIEKGRLLFDVLKKQLGRVKKGGAS